MLKINRIIDSIVETKLCLFYIFFKLYDINSLKSFGQKKKKISTLDITTVWGW